MPQAMTFVAVHPPLPGAGGFHCRLSPCTSTAVICALTKSPSSPAVALQVRSAQSASLVIGSTAPV